MDTPQKAICVGFAIIGISLLVVLMLKGNMNAHGISMLIYAFAMYTGLLIVFVGSIISCIELIFDKTKRTIANTFVAAAGSLSISAWLAIMIVSL